MTEQFDVVVIGGGHNGLTTACLAAMKGERVALVEKRDSPGGLAESVEFAPGFWNEPQDKVIVKPALGQDGGNEQ